MKKVTMGLDLGTTNTAMAGLDEAGQPRNVKNAEGHYTTPSVIAILPSDEIIVGAEAKNLAAAYPDCLIREIKRHMGSVDDEGNPISYFVDHNAKEWTPEALSALIINKSIKDFELNTGLEVGDLVITCPNYFNERARLATINAGKIAGVHILDVVDEPTAAAVKYGLNHKTSGVRYYMIYDLGGGTFDVTIVKVDETDITAISTEGACDLGGGDWDLRVMAKIEQKCNEKGIKLDPVADAALYQEMRDRAERLKHSLSSRSEAEFNMRMSDEVVRFTYTSDEFESDSSDLLERTTDKVRSALDAANLNPKEIDDTVLVGGGTRMPMVTKLLEELMGKPPKRDADVDLVVSQGAVITGAQMAKQDGRKVFALGGIEPLSLPGVEFKNVAAHTLGCAAINRSTGHEEFTPIIDKNTTLPASGTQPFALNAEGQTTADVRVYQQEENQPLEECLHIGTVTITGVPNAPLDDPRIQVTYEYSRSGIVKVTVTDRVSGKSEVAELQHKSGMSEKEVEAASQMIKENS